jgi:hypothetical protein
VTDTGVGLAPGEILDLVAHGRVQLGARGPGFSRHDSIGQLGVGLPATFPAADSVVVDVEPPVSHLPRSARP